MSFNFVRGGVGYKFFRLKISSKIFWLPWGGGSPCSNADFRANVKVSVFWNGQFRGHLMFYKKTFWGKKTSLWPDKQALCFFEKKCFGGKCFFEEFFFKISRTVPPKKSLSKFFWNFFEKKFPQKTFKKKKKKNVFFQKNKVLVYWCQKIFFFPQKVFL